jgi:hypothetical protein
MANAIDPLARVISLLLKDGAAPRSAASARALARMQTLFDSGSLVIIRRGAGDAIKIANRSALDRFIDAEYPAGLNWKTDNPTRADAAFFAKDSKRGRVDFSLMTFHGRAGQYTQNGEDRCLRYGKPESVFLDDVADTNPVFSGITSIALIENIEVFRHYMKAGIVADMAFWTAGRMPGRFISWLASDAWPTATAIIHCGDYDVVGLREFDRVYQTLKERVRLHVPPDIETLFKHGSGDLLDKQRDKQFQSLLRHPDANCRRIANLMIETGHGLEQEVLLPRTVKNSSNAHGSGV